ncbi:ABC transporter permease [Fulvivirgaceae bacterium PWU4]|uniref:ABC transporter permease n=1 Tax=Chryseosolibacter histidini TaxID=2782349 RepID=A0AAP2DMJ9_9BACT|nr:ABC transporter permease [Chryseosolibacter histidini]MBT1697877.1 ABC transporter permease [Chryseosolibacter histidini]
MFKNYLITTFRNISRRKGFSILNVLGLSIGLAASILILQYVKDELSFDDFHKNAARIHRVRFDAYRGGEQIFKCATAFPKVAPMLKADFPEVEDATRLYLRYGGGVVRYEDVAIKEDNLFQAEQNFFSIFSYPLIEGTARLNEPNTAIVEKETARKYFGEANPIGKRVKFGDREEYEITGIMESPANSHLKFTFLFSYPTLVTLWGKQFDEAWGWYDFYNYVLLKPGADPQALEAKFPAFIDKYGNGEKESERTKFVLQPLEDIHLYSDLIQEASVNGNGDAVYFLMVIALFILVIAWVNYINLATARAIERAKEVGIRKSIGAHKGQLIWQFIAEAVVINFAAAAFGLAMVYAAIPLFNEMADKHLSHSIFYDSNLWLSLAVLFMIGSFLSGLYPAFVLSSYQPAKVLKGAMKGSREGMFLRKALVVGQFAASVLLITGTIIVYRQLQFMQNRDLGIDIDQTLVINAPGFLAIDSLYGNYLQGYRNSLENHPDIKNFTATTEVPGNLVFWTNGAKRVGDDDSQRNMMYLIGIDHEFFATFGNEFLAGRGYSKEFTGDNKSVIVNRKAVEIFNLKSPEQAVGQQIQIGRDTLNVVGVVENYHQEGLKQDFRPTAFRLQSDARSYFCVKLNTRNLPQTMAFLKEKYAAVFPNNPFDYFFLDTFFNRQYKNERQFGSVFGFFAGLAIFVACLGLFGLASFTAVQRTKEIGIRKVMGSSVPNIFLLLSKDFLKLVLIANLIAIPLIWLVMDRWWLNAFVFRIDIGVSVFVIAALLTTLIALITVSYQSLTAAMANPVKSLRYE